MPSRFRQLAWYGSRARIDRFPEDVQRLNWHFDRADNCVETTKGNTFTTATVTNTSTWRDHGPVTAGVEVSTAGVRPTARELPLKTFGIVGGLCCVLVVSACARQPDPPPTVTDAKLSTQEVSPGESFGLTFGLKVVDPEAVERIHVRGLPENSIFAGTKTELSPPLGYDTPYTATILVERPAADGVFSLEIVIETTDRTFVAPLGVLTIRDTPSRILHAQFKNGSHAAADCLGKTKLIELKYAVADENGAADFSSPIIAAVNEEAKDLVFFPHWAPVAWLNDEPGILLNKPSHNWAEEEIVSSEIRILCGVPEKSLYEFIFKGRNVSKVTGQSTTIKSDSVRYYVE